MRDGSPSAAPPLKHGDRVTITGASHPWQGQSGTLVEPESGAVFPWMVAMDHGATMFAYVYENEVTRV